MNTRPKSNREYYVIDRETGKMVKVEATPTPKEEYRDYESRAGIRRKGYFESLKDPQKKKDRIRERFKR